MCCKNYSVNIPWNFVMSVTPVLSFGSIQKKLWEILLIVILHYFVKVKSEHRSKFFNLSNWREEAWKISVLQRDPWPLRYRRDARPTELWSHTLGARSICWVHIFPCSEMMWNIYEMCGFTAQLVEHRTGVAEVTGSNPVEALIFFRLLPSNCLNWKIYCDDHSSLSSTTAVQYEFHKSFTHFTNLVPRVSLLPFLGAGERRDMTRSKEGKKGDPGNEVDISHLYTHFMSTLGRHK